jgi:predicted nucleic acid-binding protein
MRSTALPASWLLDTNVLISAMRFAGPPRGLLEAAVAGEVRLLEPDYVLREVRRVLLTKFLLAPHDVEAAIAGLPAQVIPNPPVALVMRAETLINDRADAPVLAAAWQSKVQAIVTGDLHFFLPVIRETVEVMTPREALDMLRRARKE